MSPVVGSDIVNFIMKKGGSVRVVEAIEGSSPKKLYRRHHNHNPTYHSHKMQSLIGMDPVPQNLSPRGRDSMTYKSKYMNDALHYQYPVRQRQTPALPRRQSAIELPAASNSTLTPAKGSLPHMDSLDRIQHELKPAPNRNPCFFSESQSRNTFDKLQAEPQPRSKSTSFLDPSIAIARTVLNYQHDRGIRQKQVVGYDIITNRGPAPL